MEEIKCEILPENNSEYGITFKIIVIGESGVGKSCLTVAATRNYFDEIYNPTVGFEFFTFSVKLNDEVVKLQIWDTCGQEVYRSLVSSFYRNSSLAVLVYAIDDENSYNSLESWLNEIRTMSNPGIKLFLIGNKCDLEDKRKIFTEDAKKFAEDHEIDFFLESSAKTGLNAKKIFIEAAKVLYKLHCEYKTRMTNVEFEDPSKPLPEKDSKAILTEDDDASSKKKKGCC